MMTNLLTIDEFHVTVLVRRRRPEPEYMAVRRTLDSRRFRAELARAIRQVFRRYPALLKVWVQVSR